MASFCTPLKPCDPPPPRGPLAKRPPQEPHFQQLATVQNEPPATPVIPTTCHSPTPGGRGGPESPRSLFTDH